MTDGDTTVILPQLRGYDRRFTDSLYPSGNGQKIMHEILAREAMRRDRTSEHGGWLPLTAHSGSGGLFS